YIRRRRCQLLRFPGYDPLFDAGRRRLDTADDPARGARRLRLVAHAIPRPAGLPQLGAVTALHAADRDHRAARLHVSLSPPARHGIWPRPDRYADEHSDLRAADEVVLRRRGERGG